MRVAQDEDDDGTDDIANNLFVIKNSANDIEILYTHYYGLFI